MTIGTFGECATLTYPELQAFVDCVVRTTGPEPSTVAPDEYVALSLECGRRWKQLQTEFAEVPAAR
jgi:hypothetical protein